MSFSPFNHDSDNENAASLAMAERFAAEIEARKTREIRARLAEFGLEPAAYATDTPLPDRLKACGLVE